MTCTTCGQDIAPLTEFPDGKGGLSCLGRRSCPPPQTKLAADALRDDGDTYTLPDGRMLRVRVLDDCQSNINDYDSDGKVSPNYRYLYGEAHTPRPDDFDGRAVKIETGQGYWAWWQPCEGAVYPTRADFDRDRARIADLMRYGFVGVSVELCDGYDAYCQPIVRDTESLWGLEWDVMHHDRHHTVRLRVILCESAPLGE